MNMLNLIKRKAANNMMSQIMKGYVTKDIYVGNLSYTVVEDDIKELFQDETSQGFIQEFRVPIDRFSGQIRGFAFLSTEENQIQSIIDKYDGMEFKGRNLKVNLAMAKKTSLE